MDAKPEEQPIPQQLIINGATGNNDFLVNGSYKLQEGLYNHRPFWQKTTDAKIFLSFMSNNRWYVTESARKDANQPGGWLKGEGDFLPTSVVEWSVVNGGKWARQPVCLQVVRHRELQVAAESSIDERLAQVVASMLEGTWLVVNNPSQGKHRFRVRGGRILDSYGVSFIENSQPLAYRFSDGVRIWKATLSACSEELSQLTWSTSDESNRVICWEKQLGGLSPRKRAVALSKSLIQRLGTPTNRQLSTLDQEPTARLAATAGLVGTGYRAAPIRKRQANRIGHISRVLRSPAFRSVTICGASGALALSPVGGAFGCAGGILIGGVAGAVPALITFGASIPVGAAIGGFVGAPVGACAFSLLGVAAGGTSAAAYVWRTEIKDGIVRLRVEVVQKRREVCVYAIEAGASACAPVLRPVVTLSREAVKLGSSAGIRGAEMVKSQRAQATVAGAAAGVATGGTVGGAAGLLTGAGLGAIAGVPAALFTFGLSVPLGAALGGSLGCAAGAGVGGAAGGAIGGAAGYQAHKHGGLRTGPLATLRLKRASPEQAAREACVSGGAGGCTGGTEGAATN